MCIKSPHTHFHKRSQIWMLRSKPFFSLGQARFWCFPFVHHVLTDSCLMFTEFSSTSNWKQTSQSPASKCWTLLWSKFLFPYNFFFIFDSVKLKIFFGIGFFHRGRKIGKVIICGKCSLLYGLTSCALNEQQKSRWFYMER